MPFNQARYEDLRLQLVDRNEANVRNIYLDVLGIPTVGIGVALTARQRDRSMALNHDHIDALADVMNLRPAQRQQLTGLLERQLTVQNDHVDERYNRLNQFLASDFGRDSQRVYGPIVNTTHQSPNGTSYSWDVLTSPQSPMQIRLTRQQSLALFDRIAPEYEGRVDATLRRANCPPEALSEEQRAAIYSMVYHGASGKASRTADAIGDYWRGEITENALQSRLRSAVNDPNFPERSRNELDFLSHIRERPQRGRASLEGSENDSQMASATLNQNDRAVFDRIRSGIGDSVSDSAVLQATADIRTAGLRRAESIDNVGLHNGAIFVSSDHTAGYASSKTMIEGQDIRPDQAMAQIRQVNQQQEQTTQQWAMQQPARSPVAS
jgi:GH24 family phage-related lysozyme (muramidase)